MIRSASCFATIQRRRQASEDSGYTRPRALSEPGVEFLQQPQSSEEWKVYTPAEDAKSRRVARPLLKSKHLMLSSSKSAFHILKAAPRAQWVGINDLMYMELFINYPGRFRPLPNKIIFNEVRDKKCRDWKRIKFVQDRVYDQFFRETTTFNLHTYKHSSQGLHPLRLDPPPVIVNDPTIQEIWQRFFSLHHNSDEARTMAGVKHIVFDIEVDPWGPWGGDINGVVPDPKDLLQWKNIESFTYRILDGRPLLLREYQSTYRDFGYPMRNGLSSETPREGKGKSAEWKMLLTDYGLGDVLKACMLKPLGYAKHLRTPMRLEDAFGEDFHDAELVGKWTETVRRFEELGRKPPNFRIVRMFPWEAREMLMTYDQERKYRGKYERALKAAWARAEWDAKYWKQTSYENGDTYVWKYLDDFVAP